MTDEPIKNPSSIIYGTDGWITITKPNGETHDLEIIDDVHIDRAAEGEDETVAAFQRMNWGHVEVDFKLDPEAWELYNKTFFPSRLGGIVFDTPISTVGFPDVGESPIASFVFAQVEAQKYQEAMEHMRLSFEKVGESIIDGWSRGWNWTFQGTAQWDFPRIKRTPVPLSTKLRTQYPGLNKRKAERLAQSLRKRGLR